MNQKPNKFCNAELLDETSRTTGESMNQVRGAVNFFSSFIAKTIAEGAFDSVLVPYFGKFQPKVKEVQWRAQNKGVSKGASIEETNKQIAQHAGTIQDNGDL